MQVAFTNRELDVMAVLWDLGKATVNEVRDHLSDELAYTTVLTVLRILETKGHVAHEQVGRAHRYYPLVRRGAARRSELKRVLTKVFQGSAALLLTQLVSDRGLTDKEIRELRRLLAQRLQARERSS